MPTLLLAVLTVTVVLAVGYGASTSDAAFGVANPGWEGTTELRDAVTASGAEVIVATDRGRFRSVPANGSGSADGTVAYVLAPGEHTGAERRALRGFVRRGGRAVVATRDPVAGNELLAALGADVRVDGALLRDEEEHAYGPAFPTVASTANHSAVRGIEGLSLNHGTALVLGEEARPLANSSAFAYLDRDGDGELDDAETLGARPVVAAQPVGNGEVVAVADPSVFINAMLEVRANRRFARNLVADSDVVVIDRTDDGVPPLFGLLQWMRGDWLAAPLVGLGLVGVVLAWERRVHGRIASRVGSSVGTVTGSTPRATDAVRRRHDDPGGTRRTVDGPAGSFEAASWNDADGAVHRRPPAGETPGRDADRTADGFDSTLGGVMGRERETTSDERGE